MTSAGETGLLLRDRKKANTRRALIQQAVALFSTLGFEATTVDDIVAAAGCSQRTFFRHFNSKEDVVFDDLSAYLREFEQTLHAVPESVEPWRAISLVIRQAIRRFTDEDSSLTEARIRMWMTEPALYTRWTEISLEWETALTRFLRTRQPDKSDLDAEATAAAVIAVLRAAFRSEVLHGGNFDDLVAHALDLLDRGLSHSSSLAG